MKNYLLRNRLIKLRYVVVATLIITLVGTMAFASDYSNHQASSSAVTPVTPVVNAKPASSTKKLVPSQPKRTTINSSPSQVVCRKTSIPYITIYQDVSWLDVGQTQSFAGINGVVNACNGKVTSSLPPTYAVVYRGTGKPYVVTIPAPTPVDLEPYSVPSTTKPSVSQCQVIPPGSAHDYCLYLAWQ